MSKNANKSTEAVKKIKATTTKQNFEVEQERPVEEAVALSSGNIKIANVTLRLHENRLDRLLVSNGLCRSKVYPDGDCFAKAILHHVKDQTIDVTNLRNKAVDHLAKNFEYYKHFVTSDPTPDMSEEEALGQYLNSIEELNECGKWNNDVSDLFVQVVASLLCKPIKIYSSDINTPVNIVSPDGSEVSLENIIETKCENAHVNVALTAIRNKEHYDAVIAEVITTPVKDGNKAELQHTTPRKAANYQSPKMKKSGRWKKATPENWKRNIKKKLKLQGKEYLTESGKCVSEKSVEKVDCSKCRFKCSSEVNESKRQEIFRQFWNIGNYERQRAFVASYVTEQKSKGLEGCIREMARTYFLPYADGNVRVCKKFFLATLSIGKKVVDYALKKKVSGVYVGTDMRGKKPSGNKFPSHVIDFVHKHIESFPRTASHYTRKDSQREYLDQNLNIRKMYKLYTELASQEGMTEVISERSYRKIFCENYNLSFFKPKKDQCTICSCYEVKKEAGSLTEKEKEAFDAHMKCKEMCRDEKRKDKARALSDSTFYSATFDLEKVLQTPCSLVSELYYRRKLSSYNLSFYSLHDKTAVCYLWDESHGGRGSSEIGTCLIDHITSVTSKNKNITELSYFSDTCGGQNRNQYVTAALHYALHHTSAQIISHKFLESGHSTMESDSIHAAIETAKKNTRIYVPSQWDTVIAMARKKNPYRVIPMSFSSFKDIKDLKSTNYNSVKIDQNGDKVNWLKIKWIKVTKDHPENVFVNSTFEEANFQQLKFCRISRKKNLSTKHFELKPLYQSKIPISKAKTADLLALCTKGIIPEDCHEFYKGLPSVTRKDRLPEADVLEGDSDDSC